MANEVTIDFKVASAQAVSGLNKIDKSVKAVGKQVSTMKLALANVAGAAIIGGFKLLAKGIGEFISVMSESIDLARIQEDAINDLNTALKSSGQFSIEASEDLQKYASSLQQTSIYGDEAILKAQALGVSMAQLSGQELKDATLAAANMASAIGVDLNTAMRMLAKSASDGGSGLKRYGIVVEKGKDESESLANAIAKVNEQFSGAALGKIKTYGGAIQQAKNSFGDMQEELGFIVTKSPVVIGIINQLNKAWVLMGDYIKGNQTKIQNWIKNGMLLAIDTLIAIVPYINPVIKAFKVMGTAISIMVNSMQTQFFAFQAVSSKIWLTIIQTINSAISALPDSFIPDGWKENLQSAEDTIKEHTSNMVESTKSNALEMIEDIKGIGDAFEDTVSEENIEAITEKLETMRDSVAESSTQVIEIKTKEQLALDKIEQDRIKAEDKRRKDLEKKEKKHKGYLRLITGEQVAYEELTNKQKVSNQMSTLATISTLSESHHKGLAVIGKAAAIAQATISGIQAVNVALASAPPPFNFVLAGLVGVAATANVAKISGVNAFTDGGIVGGSSFSGDNQVAYLNSREMVLNDSQQSNLFAIANGQGGNNTELIGAINNLGNRIANMEIVLQADDYEIARSTQRGIDNGFNLKVG